MVLAKHLGFFFQELVLYPLRLLVPHVWTLQVMTFTNVILKESDHIYKSMYCEIRDSRYEGDIVCLHVFICVWVFLCDCMFLHLHVSADGNQRKHYILFLMHCLPYYILIFLSLFLLFFRQSLLFAYNVPSKLS